MKHKPKNPSVIYSTNPKMDTSGTPPGAYLDALFIQKDFSKNNTITQPKNLKKLQSSVLFVSYKFF